VGETSDFTFTTRDERETRDAGERLASELTDGDVLVLCGDLGAGKTAFVRGIARGLGYDDPVTSPTFNILVAHEGPLRLNHFDLYRLDEASQLEDVDFWGVIEGGGVTAIEWGDRFPSALPPEYVEIAIVFLDADAREFRVQGVGVRGERLVAAWAARLEGSAAG
jgi:tRNA threonylcarbamoyladenosine biosynthesis protein TsaE